MCTVRGLVKTYPAAQTPARGAGHAAPVRANDGIDLDVRRGEIFGLLGPNGAGKSTLVRQLTGLLRPDAGRIDLLGHDLVRHPERASRLIGYLGQESTALDELTVALAAETTGRLRGLTPAAARAERDAVLDELGLGRARRAGPLKKLSGGQRRLACFAAGAGRGSGPCWCWTSRPPAWTRSPGARCGRRSTGGAPSGRHDRGAGHPQRHRGRDRARPGRRARPRPGHRLRHPGGLQGAGRPTRSGSTWCGATRRRWTLPAGRRARARRAEISGRRWTLRLPHDRARAAVADVTGGPAFAALDDFTLATPSLEDVYLALGGRGEGLVKA